MTSFQKAQRNQVKIKIALTGPTHAGKTYSALKIAQGLAGASGRIAMIDTENGSGSLYSDVPGMPEYDISLLAPPFTSDRYMKLIDEAIAAKYDVLIIDSISHQWNAEGGILDRKDKEMVAKPGANSYALWAKYTPEFARFTQKILQAPIHVIVTMRSKMDYVLDVNEKGKQAPKKVGLAPIQRDGIEYEFTIVFDLTAEKHIATASKDRTGLFDQKYFMPDAETGRLIQEWINSGKEPVAEQSFDNNFDNADFKMGPDEWNVIKGLCESAQIKSDVVQKYIKEVIKKAPAALNREDFDALKKHIVTEYLEGKK